METIEPSSSTFLTTDVFIVVSTLPIRNGNKYAFTRFIVCIYPFRKYLTYKEWKQINICQLKCNSSKRMTHRKYLTYKEWKHHSLQLQKP